MSPGGCLVCLLLGCLPGCDPRSDRHEAPGASPPPLWIDTPPSRTVALPDSPPYALALGLGLVRDFEDCAGDDACPRTDQGKARRKAGVAFRSAAEIVEVAEIKDARIDDSVPNEEVFVLPDERGSFFISTGPSIETADSSVSLLVQKGTASVYEVVEGQQWGVVVCVLANRSIRTPTKTYENTADRICLWGRIDGAL
jgi:hypothetical protein